jgi:hypothetical protein
MAWIGQPLPVSLRQSSVEDWCPQPQFQRAAGTGLGHSPTLRGLIATRQTGKEGCWTEASQTPQQQGGGDDHIQLSPKIMPS